MALDGPGATLLMRMPAKRFNRELVEQMLGILFEIQHKDRHQSKLWENLEWRTKYVNEIHDNRAVFGVVTFWNPPQDGLIGARTVAQYYLDLRNKLALDEEGSIWVVIWVQEGNFDPTEFEKAKRVTANFKTIVRKLQPTFAAVDNYGENMAKRKGKDPRRFAWGAMYYDADHVERIGVDKLRGCAAKVKEEWPDDSMWVQTWENPFIVAKELTQQMEKELGLKELLGETPVKSRVGAKKTAKVRKSS
jgi:hypothetical protein